MKTNIEILEFRIPTWALCSLINGDNSGLTDEDISKINSFCSKTVLSYGNANFCLPDEDKRNEGFYYRNDIDNMGSDCENLLLIPSI